MAIDKKQTIEMKKIAESSEISFVHLLNLLQIQSIDGDLFRWCLKMKILKQFDKTWSHFLEKT